MSGQPSPPPVTVTMAITPSTFGLQTPQTTEVEIILTVTNQADQPVTIFTGPTIFNLPLALRQKHFRCKDLTTGKSVYLEVISGVFRGAYDRTIGGDDDELFCTLEPGKPAEFRQPFEIAYRRPRAGTEHILRTIRDGNSDTEVEMDTDEESDISQGKEDSHTGKHAVKHTASESTIVPSLISRVSLGATGSGSRAAALGQPTVFTINDDAASTTSSRTSSGTSKSSSTTPDSSFSEDHAAASSSNSPVTSKSSFTVPGSRSLEDNATSSSSAPRGRPIYLTKGTTYRFSVRRGARIRYWAWGTRKDVLVPPERWVRDEDFSDDEERDGDLWFLRKIPPIRIGDVAPVTFTVEA